MTRWVYIIEGLFSALCAILIWFGLPNNPAEAYFLTEEERWMMRVRNEQRRKYMGSDNFSWEEMRIALSDPKLFFSGVIQFCQDILLYGFSTFLPTILGGMGYNSLMSNVLTVPVYIWAAIVFIAIAFCSDRYSKFASVSRAISILSFCANLSPVHLHGEYLRNYRLYSSPYGKKHRGSILCHFPYWYHHLYIRRAQCRLVECEYRPSIPPRSRDRVTTDDGKLRWNCCWSSVSQITICARELLFTGVSRGGAVCCSWIWLLLAT
jgi:hypothetical protein